MPKKVTLSVGSKVPNFALKDQDGRLVRFNDFCGKKVILYFYVRDDTPGCTKEACSFRDGMRKLHLKNAAVLGVSPDSVESHRRFVEKYHITFPLLADDDAELAKQFGVWGKKNMYGRTYQGVIRSTFIIDEDGHIAKEYRRVKVKDHLERILDDV